MLKSRLPNKREAYLLATICTVLIHFWAVIVFLYHVPAYLMRMSASDMIGIFTYTLLIAVFDSLILFGMIVLFCFLLPRRLFEGKFVAESTIVTITTFLLIAPVHFQTQILDYLAWDMKIYQLAILLWVLLYFTLIIGGSVLVHRKTQVQAAINDFVERLTVLFNLFLIVDTLSILLVLYNNLI